MSRFSFLLILLLIACITPSVNAQLVQSGVDNLLDDAALTVGGSLGLWLKGPSDLNYYSWYLDETFSTEKDETNLLLKFFFLGHLTRNFQMGLALNRTSSDLDGDRYTLTVPGGHIGGRIFIDERWLVQPAVEFGPAVIKGGGEKFSGVSVNCDVQIQYAYNDSVILFADPGFLSVPYSEESESGDQISFAPIFYLNVGASYAIRM